MKKLITTLILCLICAIGAVSLTACGGADKGTKGTYYLYDDGKYDKTNYLTLSGSTWTDDGGYSGTYEIKDGKIIFYVTIYGEKEELKGTIKDGVIFLNMLSGEKYYCKEGCTPADAKITYQGKYYLYYNGEYDYDYCLTIKDSTTWSITENNQTNYGTYKITFKDNKNKIYFYDDDGDKLADGTIEDGVINIGGDTWRKKSSKLFN